MTPPFLPAHRRELPWLINMLFRRAVQGAEIGVKAGSYSECLLRQCTWSHFFCVDLWAHQETGYEERANVSDQRHNAFLQRTRNRLQPFGDRVTIIRDWSHRAAALFADGSLDFVYIDANHTLPAVQQDLASWYPKLRQGALFAGHDYCERFPDVVTAVNEFATRHGLTVHSTSETAPQCPSWYLIKP